MSRPHPEASLLYSRERHRFSTQLDRVEGTPPRAAAAVLNHNPHCVWSWRRPVPRQEVASRVIFCSFLLLPIVPFQWGEAFRQNESHLAPKCQTNWTHPNQGKHLLYRGVCVPQRHLYIYLCLTRPSITPNGRPVEFDGQRFPPIPAKTKSGWRVRSNPRDLRDLTSSAVNFLKSSN